VPGESEAAGVAREPHLITLIAVLPPAPVGGRRNDAPEIGIGVYRLFTGLDGADFDEAFVV
jgi:hypothetical protein